MPVLIVTCFPVCDLYPWKACSFLRETNRNETGVKAMLERTEEKEKCGWDVIFERKREIERKNTKKGKK